ncbi:MAG: hypothetical protein ACSHX0_12300 [Akkermansiaceae bacterium]
MGITLLAILAFAFSGFLNNIRGLHKHSVASDESGDEQPEGESLDKVEKGSSKKDYIPLNIWFSTLCYWLSCMIIAMDAWIYTKFNYSLYAEIADGKGGVWSAMISVLLLIAGALFYGFKKSGKTLSSVWLILICGSTFFIIPIGQLYRIKYDAEKIDDSGWRSHTECKFQLEGWSRPNQIPIAELGVQTGGQAAFKITPQKYDLSEIEDWKCMIYLDQEQFNKIDYDLQKEGYEQLENAINFVVVDGSSRVQATWIKKKKIKKALPEQGEK